MLARLPLNSPLSFCTSLLVPQLALIEKTNMVDYAVDIYQQLNQTDEVGACRGVQWMGRRCAWVGDGGPAQQWA